MKAMIAVTLLSMTLITGGCASLDKAGYPLPKCNGYSKRPLNRSMWDWENGNPAAPARPTIVNNFAQAKSPANEKAFAELLSYKNCEG